MIRRIKICTGPGCRAWNAELIANRLDDETNGTNASKIIRVKCMDKCGGGASVRLKDRGKVFKLREQEEICHLIKGRVECLNEAC